MRAALELGAIEQLPELPETAEAKQAQHVLTVLKALQARHGLKERSFHSLRHYFCSVLIRHGASVEAVRMLAGHTKLDTAQRYVHANAADLTAAIAKLPSN